MLFRYKTFKSLAFISKPDVVEIDGHRLEYLGFCSEENKNKSPIIFIGGAFQNFFSFKKEVQVLSKQHPVILLDLPSQGSNQQLAPDLSFVDFAKLLHAFCDHFTINKIIPVALSYGSATAFYFADMFPNRVEKMILGGTTPKVRDSIALLLKESIRVLKSGDQNMFAQGAVLNLINYNYRTKTEINPRIIKGFFKNMKGLKENCIQRYIENTNRLLALDDVEGKPLCKTLVLTGEYDSFTSPYENFLISQKIENSQFLLIKDADHLANLEKRDVILEIYQAFFEDKPLELIEGARLVTSMGENSIDRRLNERKKLNNTFVTLKDESNNCVEAQIQDINYFGCKLKFLTSSHHNINFDKPLEFNFDSFKESELEKLELSGFIFDNESSPRCVFKRGSFAQSEDIEQYISALN